MRFVLRAAGAALVSIALVLSVLNGSAAAASTPSTPLNPPAGSVARPTGIDRAGVLQQRHAAANAARVTAAGPASLDVTNHGGPIMPSSTTFSIFWLPAGHNTVSANYVTLINRYLQNIGGTPLYDILTQYPGSNGTPANSSSFGGTWTDTTAFPAGHDGSTEAKAVTDGDIQAEVSRAITNNPSWGPATISKMYFVFTGSGVITCKASGNCSDVQYCAYHGAFSGDTIYGSMPYDGDSGGGCYAGGPSPNNDTAADAELSSLEHEHFEAVSDPHLNAWFNGGGDEIGDLCNRVMGTRDASGANIYLTGQPYEIQTEYSNADHACVKSHGPAPTVSVTGSLDFGSVPRGRSATRTVTIGNTGNASLRVLGVHLTGDPAFSVQGPGGTVDVAAGASVTYTVTFATPLNAPTGSRTGTLDITSTDLERGLISLPASATVGRAASTLVYNGATTADFHDAFTASGTLTIGGGTPVSGASVSFTLGGAETCSATTDGNGAASCQLTPAEAAGPTSVVASFGGDDQTLPSSATTPFTVTREETTLAYTGPGHIANGTAAHLSGVLKEDGTTPIAGRTVMIALGAGASQQSCAGTTDASGTAACTIGVVNQPLTAAATVPVTVTFAGDPFYLPVTGSATVRLEFYTGRAFGLSAQINLLLTSLAIPPTPDTGQVRTASASTTTTPCTVNINTLLINAAALCANVTTTLAPGTSTVTSTLQNTTIGVPGLPVIGLSGVRSTSVSSCTGSSGTATLTLTIAGVPVTVPTAPNSVINLAGGGKLVIDEQLPVPGADFGTTVNAVHLTALGGLVDVVVASSTSDAHNCS
ncbi:MAG TPA: choice-of-anchor P family protein [Pseudonocardiaceae bacterium]